MGGSALDAVPLSGFRLIKVLITHFWIDHPYGEDELTLLEEEQPSPPPHASWVTA